MIRPFVRMLVAGVLLVVAVPVQAQLVPIRTVPVASGDQFLTRPSANLGMGGVHIAVDDSIADGWGNPAKGVFISESQFIGSPTVYTISNSGGSGKTFPITGLFRGAKWFGGVSMALQQIDDSRNNGGAWIDPWVIWEGPNRRLSDVSSRNLFAAGLVGTELSGGWSVGLAASTAHLDAVDGVDLLYAGADRIDQSGGTGDIRLGLFRSSARDELSVTVVHNRISMTHDVHYVDFTWDDDPMQRPVARAHIESNQDQTRTWGAQIAWARNLTAPGWRLGTTATVNRKSHPKIPNYSIQNIPRDPGLTWAYEAGLGLARTKGGTTFGFDVLVQPIWSETWQEADTPTETAAGGVLNIGERTIDNDFFFTNVLLRTGVSHQSDDVGFQFGLEVRSYAYTLDQINHVDVSVRTQKETWMEWTPTLGGTFQLDDLEIRYAARLTTGTGQPGTARSFREEAKAAFDVGGDFIVAPDAPLTLQDANVLTHQVVLRIPIR
jgi:hypothetical protein